MSEKGEQVIAEFQLCVDGRIWRGGWSTQKLKLNIATPVEASNRTTTKVVTLCAAAGHSICYLAVVTCSDFVYLFDLTSQFRYQSLIAFLCSHHRSLATVSCIFCKAFNSSIRGLSSLLTAFCNWYFKRCRIVTSENILLIIYSVHQDMTSLHNFSMHIIFPRRPLSSFMLYVWGMFRKYTSTKVSRAGVVALKQSLSQHICCYLSFSLLWGMAW